MAAHEMVGHKLPRRGYFILGHMFAVLLNIYESLLHDFLQVSFLFGCVLLLLHESLVDGLIGLPKVPDKSSRNPKMGRGMIWNGWSQANTSSMVAMIFKFILGHLGAIPIWRFMPSSWFTSGCQHKS